MTKKPSLLDLKNKPTKSDSLISSNHDIKLSEKQGDRKKNQDKIRDKQQLFRMYPDAKKQLKSLSVELDISVTELINEGINHIFSKHKKPPIA